MKKFVVNFGGVIVDIMAFMTIIGLIISTVKVFGSQGFLAGIGVLWAGLISFIFVFFSIYLLISINDKLSGTNTNNYDKY